jgi:hypothetical protein
MIVKKLSRVEVVKLQSPRRIKAWELAFIIVGLVCMGLGLFLFY